MTVMDSYCLVKNMPRVNVYPTHKSVSGKSTRLTDLFAKHVSVNFVDINCIAFLVIRKLNVAMLLTK